MRLVTEDDSRYFVDTGLLNEAETCEPLDVLGNCSRFRSSYAYQESEHWTRAVRHRVRAQVHAALLGPAPRDRDREGVSDHYAVVAHWLNVYACGGPLPAAKLRRVALAAPWLREQLVVCRAKAIKERRTAVDGAVRRLHPCEMRPARRIAQPGGAGAATCLDTPAPFEAAKKKQGRPR